MKETTYERITRQHKILYYKYLQIIIDYIFLILNIFLFISIVFWRSRRCGVRDEKQGKLHLVLTLRPSWQSLIKKWLLENLFACRTKFCLPAQSPYLRGV